MRAIRAPGQGRREERSEERTPEALEPAHLSLQRLAGGVGNRAFSLALRGAIGIPAESVADPGLSLITAGAAALARQDAEAGEGQAAGTTTATPQQDDASAPPPDGAAVPAERAREMFNQAQELFARGRYREAIIRFERVRQLPGQPPEVGRDVLYDIGMSNLKLGRFATAILYFEEYLTKEGADVDDGQARLTEAKRGLGNSGQRR